MRLLKRQEAREALGQMPERTFNLLVSEGLPCRGEGKAARFPWPEIYRWTIDRAKRKARDQARPANYDEARAREMAAKAELAELEVAAKRGELMTVAQYDDVVGSAFQRVRSQLLTLPTKMAPEMVGLVKATEAQAKVQGFVDDVLAELHRAGDVPADGEGEHDDG